MGGLRACRLPAVSVRQRKRQRRGQQQVKESKGEIRVLEHGEMSCESARDPGEDCWGMWGPLWNVVANISHGCVRFFNRAGKSGVSRQWTQEGLVDVRGTGNPRVLLIPDCH